jgi:hypothetical protein
MVFHQSTPPKGGKNMRPAHKQHQVTIFFTGLPICVFLGFHTTASYGQINAAAENTLQSQTILQNRIGGETVQRQSEILRMDTTATQLESRISKLERQLLSTHSYPALTTAEAKAALALAIAQNIEIRSLPSKPTQVQIATGRLAVTRAESQLAIALALQKESMIFCELDIIAAERELLRTSKYFEMQQRLIAKGRTTSRGLAENKFAVTAAQRKVDLMRLRLKTLQTLEGITDSETDDEPREPPASSNEP